MAPDGATCSKSFTSCANHAGLQSVRKCVTTPAWSASQLQVATRWGREVCDSGSTEAQAQLCPWHTPC